MKGEEEEREPPDPSEAFDFDHIFRPRKLSPRKVLYLTVGGCFASIFFMALFIAACKRACLHGGKEVNIYTILSRSPLTDVDCVFCYLRAGLHRPFCVNRMIFFRVVGFSTLGALLCHMISCFGMSVLEAEIRAVPWVESHTIIAGVTAFIRYNVTVPSVHLGVLDDEDSSDDGSYLLHYYPHHLHQPQMAQQQQYPPQMAQQQQQSYQQHLSYQQQYHQQRSQQQPPPQQPQQWPQQPQQWPSTGQPLSYGPGWGSEYRYYYYADNRRPIQEQDMHSPARLQRGRNFAARLQSRQLRSPTHQQQPQQQPKPPPPQKPQRPPQQQQQQQPPQPPPHQPPFYDNRLQQQQQQQQQNYKYPPKSTQNNAEPKEIGDPTSLPTPQSTLKPTLKPMPQPTPQPTLKTTHAPTALPTPKPTKPDKWEKLAARARVVMTWAECAAFAYEAAQPLSQPDEDPWLIMMAPEESWQSAFAETRGFDNGCEMCFQSGQATSVLMVLSGMALLPQLICNCLRGSVLSDSINIKFMAILFSMSGTLMTATAAAVFSRFCANEFSSRDPREPGVGWYCACASGALQFVGFVAHWIVALPTDKHTKEALRNEKLEKNEHKGYGQLKTFDPDEESADSVAVGAIPCEAAGERLEPGNHEPPARGESYPSGSARVNNLLKSALPAAGHNPDVVSPQKARESIVKFMQKGGSLDLAVSLSDELGPPRCSLPRSRSSCTQFIPLPLNRVFCQLIKVARRIVKVWRAAVKLAGGDEQYKSITGKHPPLVMFRLKCSQKMGMDLGHQTLRVHRIALGGQAETAGVKEGWFCEKVGGQSVSTLEEFSAALQQHRDKGETDCGVTFNTNLDKLSQKPSKKSFFSFSLLKKKKNKSVPVESEIPIEDAPSNAHQTIEVVYLAQAMVQMDEGVSLEAGKAWEAFFETNYFKEGSLPDFTEAINKETKRHEKRESRRKKKRSDNHGDKSGGGDAEEGARS